MNHILLVGGSPNPTSKSSRLLGHVGAQLARAGATTTSVTVRDLPAGPLVRCSGDDPEIATTLEELDAAQGVVLATPIYKNSISGLMKLWLDVLPQYAFRNKIVLPLATGGTQASLLALDYAIGPILTSMGSHHVLPGFFALDRWVSGAPPDGVDLPESTQALLQELVADFLQAVGTTRRPSS